MALSTRRHAHVTRHMGVSNPLKSNWSIKFKLISFRGIVGASIVFPGLRSLCSNLSATRELLLDCFAFDPQKWASVKATGFREELDWEKGVSDYLSMVVLQKWFRAQVCFPNLYIV